VVVSTVAPARREGTQDAVRVVFLDPPYAVATAEVETVLQALHGQGWLSPDALVVVERAARGPEVTWPAGLTPGRRRKYGETTLWYGHATG
jgi:16S rRNA (guanine966-N2)-methyltransferase